MKRSDWGVREVGEVGVAGGRTGGGRRAAGGGKTGKDKKGILSYTLFKSSNSYFIFIHYFFYLAFIFKTLHATSLQNRRRYSTWILRCFM
jgi:hypothetical protein